MSDITHRAVNASLWSGLEILVRYGVQFVVMVLLARLLAPSDFGLLAMLLVFSSLAGLFVDAGLGTALIQKQDTTADDETTVFVFSATLGAVAAGGMWLAAPTIAEFYGRPELTELARLLTVALPLSALGAVPDTLLTKRLAFNLRTHAEVVASLLSGCFAVVLALRDYGVWSLVWQIVIAGATRSMMLWVLAGWRPRGRVSFLAFRVLFSFGGFMLASNLLNTISVRIQSLLIGKYFDSRQLGYYTIAQNTQLAPAQFVAAVLNRVGLPTFSSLAAEPERLREALRLALRSSCFLFVPFMAVVALAAPLIISVVYGSQWAQAGPLLAVLALSTIFWPLHVLNLSAIAATGRADLVFKLEVVKRIVSIVLVLMAGVAGPMAVACAVLVSSLFALVVNTWYAQVMLGYGLRSQLVDQSGTIALTVAVMLVCGLLRHFLPVGAASLFIIAVTSGACYFVGAFLFRHGSIGELQQFAADLLESKRGARASSLP